jgi:hypothetical protein
MAVDKVLCLKERYQDTTKFTIYDESEWLDDAPDRREDAARILLAAKMDENQQLTFITTVDNSSPLDTLSWVIDSAGLGAYRFFYIDLEFWSDSIAYEGEVTEDDEVTNYGDIVYHNETYYKAIADSSDVEPGVDDGWEDYWSEYSGTFQDEIENDQLTIHIHDDISTMDYEECILDKVDAKTDAELCGACCSDVEFLNLMKMQFLLDTAISNNWQEKATRAEVILQQADKKFCC